MQTFLPYASFERTATVLDRQRLGKQRVENLQIMKALLLPGSGWANHPAVKMWTGHELALFNYHNAICYEWHDLRGYKDTCEVKMRELVDGHDLGWGPPWWLGLKSFHRQHKSTLVRKDPLYYRQHFPNVPDNLTIEYPSPEGPA